MRFNFSYTMAINILSILFIIIGLLFGENILSSQGAQSKSLNYASNYYNTRKFHKLSQIYHQAGYLSENQ